LKNTKLEPVALFAEESGVQRSTLKSQVADKLKYMISTELISEGEFLPSERNLSETFSVSRETIRGALKILSAQKFIEISRGSGTKVLKCAGSSDDTSEASKGVFPAIDMLQSYDVTTVAETRRVVEVGILRSAAMNISDDDLDRLSVLMDTQQKALDDTVAFQIADREFHNIIYYACRNDLLAGIASNIYAYALEHRNMALKAERATERSLREHRQIYRALLQHDPDAAERAITSHVDSIFKSTIMMLQTSDND